MAACGKYHTITLSNDGTLHSFGNNEHGQLGLGDNSLNMISLPTPIPNLPKIKMISCGYSFTVCVDYEGIMWSFGKNSSGQLGTGNKTICNVPQKVQDIPPVLSVSCGFSHTLIITNDSNLWSCGRNDYGQLCLGNREYQMKPQKTSFSNISKLSTGHYHSLFQNDKGDIFACGSNISGECGLRHNNHPQISPSIIPKLPPNIVQFVCGCRQSLFLDSKGKVYSVGDNVFGSLGAGHNTDQNALTSIYDIPPIKIISCVGASSYLIDFEGNLWTFGRNDCGQLGHGNKKDINFPKLVRTLKDIQHISYGSCGSHFIAKNSQNRIFVTGNNAYVQLGTGKAKSVSIPKKIKSNYSFIWGESHISRAKSARK